MNPEEDKVFHEIESKKTKISSSLSGTFKRWNELEDLYFYHTPKQKNSAKSNVFDPMAFEQVEHTVAHLAARDPRGEFIPTEPGDQISTDIMNELWKWQWNRSDADMPKKISNSIRRMAIYGISYGKIDWRYERNFNELTKKFESKWDDPFFQDLNNYDCYPDIDAQSPKDMQFFILDEFTTIEDLEAQNQGKEKRYKHLDKLKELASEDSSASVDNQYRNNLLVRNKINDLKQQEGRIKVTRCFYKDRWVTIVPDHDLVIEDRPNPYAFGGLPIVVLVDQDVPGTILGIGEIDPVRTLMVAMNQSINMRFDNIKMILEKPMQAKAAAMKWFKTWKWGRNNVMVVDNDGDIKPFELPDVTGNTFVGTMQFFQSIIKERLGRGDFLTANRGNKTATEVDAMAAEQNARMGYKVNNVENFVKEITTKMMMLNQQYLKKERAVRILGAEALTKLKSKVGEEKLKMTKDDVGFLKIKPEDIAGGFDFIVESGSMKTADTNKEIGNLNNALQLVMQSIPLYQQQGKEVDPTPIIDNILAKLGVKNLDQVIKTQNYGQAGALQPTGLNAAIAGGGVPSTQGVPSGAAGVIPGATQGLPQG